MKKILTLIMISAALTGCNIERTPSYSMSSDDVTSNPGDNPEESRVVADGEQELRLRHQGGGTGDAFTRVPLYEWYLRQS